MWISHDWKCIYIHVPRTAGTSIEKSLAYAAGINDFQNYNGSKIEHLKRLKLNPKPLGEKILPGPSMKHAKAKEIKGLVGEHVWATYYKFASVRNPWDRTLSVYLKDLRNRKMEKYRLLNSRLSFNVALWIKYGLLRRSPELQQDYLIVDDALVVDELIRFESLKSDYESVCRTLGIPATLSNNADGTGHAIYREYYFGWGKSLVEKIKKDDISRFGYSF